MSINTLLHRGHSTDRYRGKRTIGCIAGSFLLCMLAACGTTQPVDNPASSTVTATSTTTITPTVTRSAQSNATGRNTAITTHNTGTPASAQTEPQVAPAAVDQPQNTNSGTVYYKNCDAVRAAGAAPLYRNDPGYSSQLDRDGDGIACEPK